jgi:hypothetical protein
LAGITEGSGIEHYVISKKSIKTGDFIQFLEDVAAKNQGKTVALFMDNLRVHKSKAVN